MIREQASLGIHCVSQDSGPQCVKIYDIALLSFIVGHVAHRTSVLQDTMSGLQMFNVDQPRDCGTGAAKRALTFLFQDHMDIQSSRALEGFQSRAVCVELAQTDKKGASLLAGPRRNEVKHLFPH